MGDRQFNSAKFGDRVYEAARGERFPEPDVRVDVVNFIQTRARLTLQNSPSVTRESDPSGVGFGDKTTTFKKNLNATDELSAPVELVPRRARKKAGN